MNKRSARATATCALIAASLLVAAAAPWAAPVGEPAHSAAPITAGGSDVVFVTVDQAVGAALRARGCIVLSEALHTLDAAPRRVLSHAIVISRDGAENEKITFRGAPLVAVDSTTPDESATLRVGGNGEATTLPSRCQITIRPMGGRTWGAVDSAAQIELVVTAQDN